jgi:hypothetical protein
MPGEVNVPVVGKMSKSGVVVTVAAGAVVLGYVIYKKKKDQATTAAATTPNVAPPNSYGYGTPMTGSNYTGSAYGYGSAGNGYGYQTGAYGGGDNTGGAYGYYAEGDPNTPQTNAAWTQACVASLSNAGYNSETVLAACGVYLTAGELTSAQVQVIQACIAAEGYPPTEGLQGFPPQMHTGGTTTGGAAPPSSPTSTNPAYGQAGPNQSGMQAITPQEASVLESNSNYYNAKGGKKAQRPYIWNGSAYVPNTNPINSSYQYYAGPLETTEINSYKG